MGEVRVCEFIAIPCLILSHFALLLKVEAFGSLWSYFSWNGASAEVDNNSRNFELPVDTDLIFSPER
jgi:hypothetical protein